jgi:nucleoside-diphosphate-sugar epimerase
MLCLQKLPNGYHVFNAANPEPVPMKELVEAIAASLNVTKKFNSMPEGLLKIGVKAAQALMPGKVPVTTEQIEKLATETTCAIDSLVGATGFAPRYELIDALKAEIAWAKDNKLL